MSDKVPSSKNKMSDLEMKVDIHVLLYKRVDSAKLLLQSLSRTGGLTSTKTNTADDATDIYIHIDHAFELNHPHLSEEKGILIGEESTTDAERGISADLHRLAHEYQWQFGSKFVITAPIKMGLKHMWLSINPDCNKTHAIVVFEDDIMPSGGWFMWASAMFSNVIQSSIEAQRDDIIGISLASLGINELKYPFEAWKPANIGGAEYYLHQVPNSWGSVYFCHPWQDFRRYAAARTSHLFDREELGGISLEGGRPGDPNFHIDELHSNWWSKSWKKYMVEYVYAKGMLTLYPNLDLDNIGLVMHLAIKGGEHMKTKNALFQKADTATYSMIQSAVQKVFPLERASVFDIHFKKVANLKDLKKAGARYIESLRNKGPPYSDIASLLLPVTDATYLGSDSDKDGGVQETQEKKKKMPLYLGYMPQGALANQLHSLAKAAWLSIKLDRILLIPHLFLPSCKSDFNNCEDDFCLEFSDFLSFTNLSRATNSLEFVVITSGNYEFYRPDKIYSFQLDHSLRGDLDLSHRNMNFEDTKERVNGKMQAMKGNKHMKSVTYFRSLPRVPITSPLMMQSDPTIVDSISWANSIPDRVLFIEDLTPVKMPNDVGITNKIAKIGRDFYCPNTRLRRVVADLMHTMDLTEFTCLYVPAAEEICEDSVTMSLIQDLQGWQQRRGPQEDALCIPSQSQVMSFISTYVYRIHRTQIDRAIVKLFVATGSTSLYAQMMNNDKFGKLPTAIIKTSVNTKNYLLRRFPQANQRFIDGMHAFVDQTMCIMAEHALLPSSSAEQSGMSSHQINLKRQGNRVDYWLTVD